MKQSAPAREDELLDLVDQLAADGELGGEETVPTSEQSRPAERTSSFSTTKKEAKEEVPPPAAFADLPLKVRAFAEELHRDGWEPGEAISRAVSAYAAPGKKQPGQWKALRPFKLNAKRFSATAHANDRPRSALEGS